MCVATQLGIIFDGGIRAHTAYYYSYLDLKVVCVCVCVLTNIASGCISVVVVVVVQCIYMYIGSLFSSLHTLVEYKSKPRKRWW